MTQDEAGPTVSEHYTYQKAGRVACESWTPRYVDLSSLWVYKFMRKEKISHSVRYQMWPNTFKTRERFSITLLKIQVEGKDSWKEIKIKWK